eukprot:SAG11_NODE_9013_length_953_cov_2.010539_1_plen_199_part_00
MDVVSGEDATVAAASVGSAEGTAAAAVSAVGGGVSARGSEDGAPTVRRSTRTNRGDVARAAARKAAADELGEGRSRAGGLLTLEMRLQIAAMAAAMDSDSESDEGSDSDEDEESGAATAAQGAEVQIGAQARVGAGAVASGADEFAALTVPQLKAELKSRGLKVSGVKSVLLSRLRNPAGADRKSKRAKKTGDEEVLV